MYLIDYLRANIHIESLLKSLGKRMHKLDKCTPFTIHNQKDSEECLLPIT